MRVHECVPEFLPRRASVGCGVGKVALFIDGKLFTYAGITGRETGVFTWGHVSIGLSAAERSEVTIGFFNASGGEALCLGIDNVTLSPLARD